MDKNDDSTITKGCGNVFIDLGFPPSEATVMHMRVEVIARIIQQIKSNDWTKADVAHHLGITQLEANRLIETKAEGFSLDILLTLAIRTGLQVHLSWKDDNPIADIL